MSEQVNEVDKARELLEGILERMGFDGTVEASETDDRVVLDVKTEEPERIIGRRGQTIDALQHLVGKMLAKYRTGRGKPVSVDTDGYRDRHVERLEELAAKMSDKAMSTGREVSLNPMNAYDRRIVHMALKDVDGVSTRSDGEGDARHIIIVPD